ncbi:MAG: flagellar assembly protein FliH [Gammaproteobacteria bacterium]|nr:flagellar assembly protein FliH [Gammaproteobacteria bacterium]
MSERATPAGTGGVQTRVLTGPQTGQAQTWSVPQVQGPTVGRRRHGPAGAGPAAHEASDAQKDFDSARDAGLAAARDEIAARLAELDQRIARFDAALAQLAAPLAHAEEDLGRQLAQLALVVAAQLVRRELRLDPAQVIAVIRDTVALLPAAAREVRVHLHPEDAALVRERLATPQAERAWTLIEDPVLARGGCRVSTDSSDIDARLETRLREATAHVLGEARLSPADGEAAR